MGLSDYLRCEFCGSSADEGCSDDCVALAMRAEKCKAAGWDPSDSVFDSSGKSRFARVLAAEEQMQVEADQHRQRG